jgi:tRNA modification GTPase
VPSSHDAAAAVQELPGLKPAGLASASSTIFAPATGSMRAAIAIIRLSGPGCRNVCHRLTSRPTPPPRRATLRALLDPITGEALDRGLVLWCPGPASVTGEDVLELHVHGGRAVVGALLEVLAGMPGLRPAEPGEFTRRAFLNDRLDLTAAEGLADLIEAETRSQARQALRQLDGELGRIYERWRERLIGALALVEAEIDFAPEEEVPDGLIERVGPEMRRLKAEIARHLDDRRRGERLREGLTVAVIGPPNAGKSSLVNRLARRDVAIVTARPGTTRDVLEVHLDLDGRPVTVLDTAGLRDVSDEIEAEGVRRARAGAERADLRLALFDGETWPRLDPATRALIDEETILAVNKADLGRLPAAPSIAGRPAHAISCLTGDGLDELLGSLTDAAARLVCPGAGPAITRSRHRAALHEALGGLGRFCAAPPGTELALLAEELRWAARALGRITGRVGVEDVLDMIFADFCIGK